jgi:hypothetical protein
MKTKLLNFAVIISTVVMSVCTHAIASDEIILPVISKPAQLDEGTQRTLTQSQINELLPWTKNSRIALIDLLEELNDISSIKDRIEHLDNGIKSVVSESSSSSELFMRYVLNRALVLQETLKKETNENTIGIADVKFRVLLTSVKMAIKYYDIDAKTLSNQSNMNFASFGAVYSSFLIDLNKSVFDASAQYTIHKIILEWLSWDLYRDLENKSYASQIVQISTFMKTLPASKITDTQSLVYIRKMRNLEEKLEITSMVQKIEEKSPGRELKVGERVLTTNRVTGNLRDATVYADVSDSVAGTDGNNTNTHYCVKFTKPSAEERFSAYDNFVKRSDLFIASGCGAKFCVGETVIESKSRDKFTVIGIDLNGDYAIKADGREMVGMTDRELIKIK